MFMKKIIGLSILIIILAIIAGAMYSSAKHVQNKPQVTETPTGKVNGNPTNFAYEGKITFAKQGARIDAPKFSYLENGAVSKSETLLFDELSACAAPNGSQPCLEFNVTLDVPFNNKDAVIEGIRSGDGILVRKLMVTVPGDHSHKPPVGRVFISWPQALAFITSCGPTLITQTHDLDVSLHMPDGSILVAVEPMIDQVMQAVEASRPSCGVIPIATE